jgi:hypothetical protein
VWVQTQQRVLKVWEGKIGEWGEKGKFEKLLEKFNEEFVKPLVIGKDKNEYNKIMYGKAKVDTEIADLDYNNLKSFTKKFAPIPSRFERAGKLEKLVLLRFLNKVVDVYDKTVKGLTGSTDYKGKKDLQAKRFAQLLVPYLSLMEQWVVMVEKWEQELMSPSFWSFKKYLKEIRRYFKQNFEEPTADLLRAGRNFSVFAAQIGSKNDYESSLQSTIKGKRSLEDLFTLMHQNLIMSISVLNHEYGIKDTHLPPFIKKITDELSEVAPLVSWAIAGISYSMPKLKLFGIEYTYPKITLFYNLSLRGHSAILHLIHDVSNTKEKTAELSVYILGPNEWNRLFGVGALASLIPHIYPSLQLAKIPRLGANDNQLEFAFRFDEKTDLGVLRKLIIHLVSMAIFFPHNPVIALNELYKSVSSEKEKDKYKDLNEKLSLLEFMNKTSNLRKFPEEVLRFFVFNRPLIEEYFQGKQFKKAIKIMRITLETVRDEQRFKVYTKFGKFGGASDPINEFVFSKLETLFYKLPGDERVSNLLYSFIGTFPLLSLKLLSNLKKSVLDEHIQKTVDIMKSQRTYLLYFKRKDLRKKEFLDLGFKLFPKRFSELYSIVAEKEVYRKNPIDTFSFLIDLLAVDENAKVFATETIHAIEKDKKNILAGARKLYRVDPLETIKTLHSFLKIDGTKEIVRHLISDFLQDTKKLFQNIFGLIGWNKKSKKVFFEIAQKVLTDNEMIALFHDLYQYLPNCETMIPKRFQYHQIFEISPIYIKEILIKKNGLSSLYRKLATYFIKNKKIGAAEKVAINLIKEGSYKHASEIAQGIINVAKENLEEYEAAAKIGEKLLQATKPFYDAGKDLKVTKHPTANIDEAEKIQRLLEKTAESFKPVAILSKKLKELADKKKKSKE